MLNFNSKMVASILEHIVYLELRRHYEVYIGKFRTKEIDFIVIKDGKTITFNHQKVPKIKRAKRSNYKKITPVTKLM